MDFHFWQFSNNSPNYNYVANAITFLVMLHYTCTGQFFGGIACISVLGFGHNQKCPPDLLRASGYDVYYASKYMWEILPLLLYSVIVYECAAL